MNLATVTSLLLAVSCLALEANDFTSLFNGNDLSGWEGAEGIWTVQDGIVVGTCQGPEHLEENTFLIWKDGVVRDFELVATMRVIGDNNSGVQYRSRKAPDHGPFVISGYQCDVHPAIEHTGTTYEEKGRGIFGLNGKNVALDAEQNRWVLSEQEPVKANLSKWTEFRVIARGNHMIHQVNGKTTSELTDYDEAGRSLEGLIAIQLHRGNANRVEIKEIKLKHLETSEPIPFTESSLEGATKIERPRTSRPQGTGPAAKR